MGKRTLEAKNKQVEEQVVKKNEIIREMQT
jgi:hypothetical protein